MKLKLILLAVLLIVVIIFGFFAYQQVTQFFSPSITVRMNSQTVIKELRELSRLETASFTIEKVIDAGTTGNTFQEFLYGDRILLIAHGELIAGFDLSKLSDDSVKINEKNITVTLPAPELLVSNLDNEQTRVYDRTQGLLNRGNKDLESEARLAALQALEDAACEGGILQIASDNGRKQLSAFLRALGFETVTINIPSGSC